MNQSVPQWYKFALQQFAAESYLDRLETEGRSLQATLAEGNTDTRRAVEPSGFTRMTPFQTAEFIESYEIAEHRGNDSTGLSASLFRWREDGQIRYTLSIRSTEFKDFEDGGDWARDGLGADLGLITSGFALGQLAALEDFFTQSVLPIIGNERIYVTGYSLGGHLATVFTEMHAEQIRHAYLFNSPGRGELTEGTTPERLRAMVNYMRSALLRPDDTVLASLPASSAARYRPLFLSARAAYESDPTWNPFNETDQSVYGTARYRWASFATSLLFPSKSRFSRTGLDLNANSLMTSIYGNSLNADLSVTANSQVHASDKQKVFIEGQPLGVGALFERLGGDFGDTHSITLLADSLALQREFLRLDPTLSQEHIESIFAASSAQKPVALASNGQLSSAEADSLEKALFFLRRAFDANAVEAPWDDSPGGFGDFENRGRFFEELAELPQEGTYSIFDLTDKAREEIVLLAEQGDDAGRAIRYALRGLEPLAVLEGDYSEARFPGGQLELRDALADRGMTHEWIAARARFLDELIDFNMRNGAVASADIDAYFEDAELDIAIGTASGSRPVYFFADETASTVFGSEAGDFLFGSSIDDTIGANDGPDYVEGGAGSDVIDGGGGIDEVYGDSGSDALYGRGGGDRLFGGSNDDRLEGGTGEDELEGGGGFDTYVYSSGDGRDAVFDSDGVGQILYEGRALAGGERIDQFAYQDAAGTRYTLVGKDTPAQALLIDDAIYIKGYQFGNLGIMLDGELAPPVDDDPAPTVLTYTTNERLPVELNRPGIESGLRFPLAPYLRGSNSDDLVTASQGSFWTRQGADTATVTSGAIFINAGVDDDVIDASAATGAGTLIGGAGKDRILGGGAGETIHGDIVSATLESGVARIDGFIFNVADRFNLTDGPPDANALPAGWGMLQEYLTDLQLKDSVADLSFDDVYLDVSAAGWGFGSLEAFLGYMVGGESFDDYIEAGGGADVVNGGSGDDVIYGGDGNDTVFGDYLGSVIDYSLLATRFGELAALFGAPGDDYLDGGDGNDTITDEAGGNDILIGGAGDDVLGSVEGMAFSSGTAYNYLDGGPGDDVLSAGGGGDAFNVVVGGEGNDQISVWADALADGGIGNDTYRYDLAERAPVLRIRDGGGDDALLSPAFIALTAPPPPPAGPGLPPPAPFLATTYTKEAFAAVAWESVPLEGKAVTEVRRVGDDLVYATSYAGGEEIRILIEDWFKGPDYKIERIGIDSPFAVPLSAAGFETWGSRQYGTDEDEFFLGEDNPDRITAAGGDDAVTTGAGDDLIAGGAGNDNLNGGDGDDAYYYALGDGDDYIYDSAGMDELWLGPGITATDVSAVNGPFALTLTVAGGTVTIESDARASASVDRFVFADGTIVSYGALAASSPFNGSAEADVIAGSDSANTLSGGGGDDLLEGFGGSDVYHFSLGDGVDQINDLPADEEVNTIAFGPGITPDMLSLGTGSLAIRVGDDGDEIHLENVDPGDVFGRHDIDLFTFEDGTQLTYAELVARGFDLKGTPQDDVLLGSNIVDRIAGGAGDDILYGGLGGDTYSFDLGGGSDVILEADEADVIDTVRFGAGIAPTGLQVSRSHDDLLLTVGSAGDALVLSAWFSTASRVVERFDFQDGTSLGAGDVELRLTAATAPPAPAVSPPPAPEPSPPPLLETTPDVVGPAPELPDLHELPRGGGQRPGPTLFHVADAPEAPSQLLIISGESDLAMPIETGSDEISQEPREAQQAAIDALFDRANQAPVALLDLQAVADATAALEAYKAEVGREDDTRSSVRRIDPQPAEARAAHIGVTPWDISFALLEAHMAKYDSSALDQSEYVHGRIGVFGGLGIEAAQELIGAANFGSDAHSLRQFAGLKDGFALLR